MARQPKNLHRVLATGTVALLLGALATAVAAAPSHEEGPDEPTAPSPAAARGGAGGPLQDDDPPDCHPMCIPPVFP